MKFIGREKELQLLKTKINSQKAEFIAITGRRRVGKTFMVRTLIENYNYIEFVGEKNAPLQIQLNRFYTSIVTKLKSELPIKEPTSWQEGFLLLTNYIKTQNKNKPLIIFIDELPWLATQKSGLLQALDYYWNSEWSKCKNLTLIVCGSATSWLRDKIINAKGGLYNRITGSIHLLPLNLQETKLYFKEKQIHFTDYHILEAYMSVGGIPFYLEQFQKSYSLAQNISNICFNNNGLLYGEYERLFKSLFGEESIYEDIIENTMKHHYGILRNELLKSLKIKSGGYLTKYLNDLESSGFIQKFVPYGFNRKEQLFKVTDEFTVFYHYWILPFTRSSLNKMNSKYWLNASTKPAYKVWSALAFESLCLKHSDLIIKKLEIEGIVENISYNWIAKGNANLKGAQADLLLFRTDGVVNICEIKFSQNPIIIDKEMATNLLNKIEAFKRSVAGNREVHLTMITANGIKSNAWSNDLLNSQINIADFL